MCSCVWYGSVLTEVCIIKIIPSPTVYTFIVTDHFLLRQITIFGSSACWKVQAIC